MVRMAAAAKVIFVLLLFVAAGCSGFSKSDREDLIKQLGETADTFNKFFKWTDFDSAAAFVDPKSMENYARWAADHEDRFMAESYQIMTCMLEDPNATKPPFDAKVVVKFKGVVILPEANRRDYVWTQKWTYQANGWMIRPEFSVFEH